MKLLSWDIGFHHISYAKWSAQPITKIQDCPAQLDLEYWNVWSVTEQWCQFSDPVHGTMCCTSSSYSVEDPIPYESSYLKSPIDICCELHNVTSKKKGAPVKYTHSIEHIPAYIPCKTAVRDSICFRKGVVSSEPITGDSISPEPMYQMCEAHKKKWSEGHWTKTKKQTTQDWITWGKRMYMYLKDHPEIWEDVDHVLIENQPSMKNPTMKTYQAILSSFFLQKSLEGYPNIQIHLLSATNKNKVPFPPSESMPMGNHQSIQKGKSSYKENKQSSIQCCEEWLTYLQFPEWVPYFAKFHKKDDLADSFLQGLYYILLTYSCLPKVATAGKKKSSGKKTKENDSIDLSEVV
jgi:Poxvirus A22 protein